MINAICFTLLSMLFPWQSVGHSIECLKNNEMQCNLSKFLKPLDKRDSDLATLPIVNNTRITSKFTRHARGQQNVCVDIVDINDVITRLRYQLLLGPCVNIDIIKKCDISLYDMAL